MEIPKELNVDIAAKIERFQREINWMKKAWEAGDVRNEMAGLMSEHFVQINTVAVSFAKMFEVMISTLSDEQLEKFKPQVTEIFEAITIIKGHNPRFLELYKHLPNKHDMLLATVDTPPLMM